MKLALTILAISLSSLFGQDRSLIFSTGSPIGIEGYSIQWDGTSGQSVSDRIYISENMVPEKNNDKRSEKDFPYLKIE